MRDFPSLRNITRGVHEEPLELFLQEMLGRVAGFVVDVHIGSFNNRQALELGLELLGNVVRRLERLLGMEHNVDLDDNPGTRMPSTYSVETDNVWAVCHGWCYVLVRLNVVTLDNGDNPQIYVISCRV